MPVFIRVGHNHNKQPAMAIAGIPNISSDTQSPIGLRGFISGFCIVGRTAAVLTFFIFLSKQKRRGDYSTDFPPATWITWACDLRSIDQHRLRVAVAIMIHPGIIALIRIPMPARIRSTGPRIIQFRLNRKIAVTMVKINPTISEPRAATVRCPCVF